MAQLFEKFRNATVALGMALVLGAGSAAAATLGQFIPVTGGATISGSGSATLSSTGIGFVGAGSASGGSLVGTTPVPSNSLTLTASGSTIGSGDFIGNILIPPPPFPTLSPFLSGSFEDAKAETGILSFLFAVNGGSGASNFGSHVIYTLNNPGFTPDTIADLSLIQPAGTQTATPVSFSIQQAAPIPLPAGLVLLLTALGALGLARRRAAA